MKFGQFSCPFKCNNKGANYCSSAKEAVISGCDYHKILNAPALEGALEKSIPNLFILYLLSKTEH